MYYILKKLYLQYISTNITQFLFYYISGDYMKKFFKFILVFILGIMSGYYICNINPQKMFDTSYKAFQVGVYTSIDLANTYKSKHKNAIVIKDNELYRVYVAILRKENNIENMSNYLNKNNIDYYIRDINISDKNLKNTIDEYENIMSSDSEVVFLEINKMIMERYEESI